MGPHPASPATALGRVATLLSWLPPHLTKQGSVPYKEECNALSDAKVSEWFPQPGLAEKLNPRTRGATTRQYVGSTVSALQAVERSKTINEYERELCGKDILRRASRSQGLRSHKRSYASAWVG